MRTRILTTEEIQFLEMVTNRILEPINGKLTIPNKPVTLHITTSDGRGGNIKKWEEPLYHIFVMSDKGNFEFSESFHDFAELPGIAWHLAGNIFHELDNDMNGPLAENLWPKDNGFRADYERFLEINT